MVLLLWITKTFPVHSSALTASFMSLTIFRTFIYSYDDVPGSQTAAVFGRLDYKSWSVKKAWCIWYDTQFWESRDTTNRKVKELIVFLCEAAIHLQSSLYPFNLEEEIKRKMSQFFTDKSPDCTGSESLVPEGPVWSCWHLPPWLPGCEWLSPGAVWDHLSQRQEQPKSDKHRVSLGWGSASSCWPHWPGCPGEGSGVYWGNIWKTNTSVPQY